MPKEKSEKPNSSTPSDLCEEGSWKQNVEAFLCPCFLFVKMESQSGAMVETFKLTRR